MGIIEKLKNPGYPAADQNILMRCAVTNCVEETPAINRRVSVKYQYVARDTYAPVAAPSAWSSAEMAYMGKDGNGLDWYEGTIPTQRVGYVWYYYQVDYDGYSWSGALEPNGATVSESISPAYWDAGADTHDRPIAGTKFQVRPYRSRYGRISLVGQTQDLSIPEMTLVDNEQWQAIVPVSGYNVVSNYFVGYGYYEDDAAEYEAEPVTWGENNPDAPSDPTLAGFLESSHDTQVTNQLVALNQKNYTGFYLYRFSSNDKDAAAAQTPDGDRRYDYIVKKAVYQDFDDWTASPDYYESSLGGLPTLTFTENFDGNAASAQSATCDTEPWAEDTYKELDKKEEIFEREELSDVFTKAGVETPNYFIRTGSRILADRKAKNTETSVNKTMALTLDGQFENTQKSIPYGLEKITFKARASVDDSNFAMYKNGTSWALPSSGNSIYVNATWSLTPMAPSKPYLSYIFLYQPASWDDGASWYEVRIIQNDSADANNNTVRVELWRKDAAASDATFVTGVAASKKYYLSTSRAVNVRAYNNSSKFTAEVYFVNDKIATVADSVARSALLTKGGTIGFGVFDAVPNISAVKVGTTNNGNDLLSSLANTWQDWAHGGQWGPDGNKTPRWTITSTLITRPVPDQRISIYAANCVEGEYNAIPSQLSLVATRTVNTLTMTDFTVDFKAWNKKFVQLRYDAGDGGVVLDNIAYYPWRAVTRYRDITSDATVGNVSYLDWTTTDQQDSWLDRILDNAGDTMRDHWAVLEGWTINNGGAFQIGANFERSRANTNLVQGIVSPELLNGIGSCSFSYAASGGKVVYGIEHSGEINEHEWVPVAVFMNDAGESGERYAKIGKYFGGRIRVRIYGASDVSGLLTANPDCGYDPAWGFTAATAKLLLDNLRVKDYPEDVNDNAWNAYNLLITGDAPDDQIYNNSGKSCFFNNHPTNGVYGAEEFTEDHPYLESPPLRGVGVGEIAFQYRLVPGTAEADTDGHIVIKVAPDRDTPLSQWKTITNLTVSASGSAFVKFDNEKIFDEKNFVVRFYNSNEPNTPRFVIDNVLITAPARASFEFEYVKLLPEQPLVGTNTIVEAKIMREVMNPKNIRIFCSYHKYDTNNVDEAWGVANWFDARTSPKIEMPAIADKIYRTPENSGIPAFATDDIVEFVVWGVHADIHTEAGDSPIIQDKETFTVPEWYRTLDLSRDMIVTNDLNVDKAEEGWSPYFWVFSCPPGTFFINEINYWRSTRESYVDYGTAEYVEFVGPAGTEIGGWKLMLVQSSETDFNYTIPSGTKLAKDTETGWGFFTWADSWAASRPGNPFRVDAAFPDSADPEDIHLGTYGGLLVYRSNGMIEQMISFGNDRWVEGDYWKFAGSKRNTYPDSLSLVSNESGEQTIAGRTVDDFNWQTAPQTPVGVNGESQIFADLGGGAVVALYDPDGHEITDADVLAWIDRYGAAQVDINKLTMAQFNEDFLLNLDLTKACVAELKITSIQIVDGVVYLNVQLTRTENGAPVARAINGTLKLRGKANLSTGTFTALDGATIGNAKFSNVTTTGVEYELPSSNPPAFFKAVIE